MMKEEKHNDNYKPKEIEDHLLEMEIERKDDKSTSNDNGLAHATGLIMSFRIL